MFTNFNHIFYAFGFSAIVVNTVEVDMLAAPDTAGEGLMWLVHPLLSFSTSFSTKGVFGSSVDLSV